MTPAFTIPGWISSELPGSGGTLLDNPDDFVVEEVLAYAPSGLGEHLYVWFEKRGLTTPAAVSDIARALGVSANAAGFAGMKDKNAKTRQWVSFPWPIKRPVPQLSPESVQVLEVTRHENKIKRGHAKQNRFSIQIRDVPDGGAERARAVLDRLRLTGVPNPFGPQRFGQDGDNAERAIRWLSGAERPSGPPRIRSLILSSLQSELFNRVLDRRVRSGSLTQALLGDVMKKHDTGGLFDVTDPKAEQPRVDAVAISPTGPMPGERMRSASAEALELENQVLSSLPLDAAALKKLGAGTRRELRYPLDPGVRLTPNEFGYRVEVTLPGGAYATSFLAELIKPDSRLVLRHEDTDIDD